MNSQSLLEGKIKPQLIKLSIPLFLGNMLQQLYNTADSLIVRGFIGPEAFASTGVSGSIMNLFIFILQGFCTGIAVLFSRSYGAKNEKEFRKQLYTALVFGSGFTIALSIFFIIIIKPILHMMQTPNDIFGYCVSYLTIILAGLITTYLYNLFTGVLSSLGNTRASLIFLTISVIFNVLFDYLFVGPLNLGIAGAAYATVLAQGISAFCCYIYFIKKYPHLMCSKEDSGFYKDILSSIFSYGSGSAIHQSSIYIGKILIQGIVNGLGTSVIAAFTATTRIEAFINAPGNSIAQVVSIFTSQNKGAGNKKRVEDGLRESFVLVETFTISMSVIMFFLAPYILPIFVGHEDPVAFQSALSYLKIIFFFYVFNNAGNFFVGCAKAHGWMSVPVVGTCTHLAFRIVISYLFANKIGLSAVAIGTGIGWMFCVIYHFIMFRKIVKTENYAILKKRV